MNVSTKISTIKSEKKKEINKYKAFSLKKLEDNSNNDTTATNNKPLVWLPRKREELYILGMKEGRLL